MGCSLAVNNKYSKSFRLLSRNDFINLKNKSLSIKEKNMMAYFSSLQTPFIQTRLGISVPKKIGHAVFRNRIKRYIREFFRTSQFKFLNRDILIVVFKTLTEDIKSHNSFPVISQDLVRLFKRISEYR